MKIKSIKDYLPFFALTLANVVTLFVYLFAFNGRDGIKILEVCVVPFIPLIIPALNKIFKISVPFSFNVAVTVFAFLAIDLASVLDFYGLIPYFDKFIHTVFGIIGAFGIFILLLYGNGEKLKPWCFFTVILLSVLGIAALWEIYEYFANMITHTDMQRWLPDFNTVGDMTVKEFFSTYNPLWDTIWDIVVAAIGVFIFFAGILADKFCGYKLSKSVYNQVKIKPYSQLTV